MMSASTRRLRSKHRFGFRGTRPSRNPEAVTADEILDSLTRQAASMEGDGRERSLGLETLLEVGLDDHVIQPSDLEPARTIYRLNTRLGKTAFSAMLVGGLAFLWFYSRLSQILSLNSLTMVQQSISRAGFADWQKIAIIAFFALVMALLAQNSRNRSRSRLVSQV
jgi:hypothetical protein